MDVKIITIFTAQSIIERDALVHELRENGIEALGAERDLSRKLSNNSVDLAFEGYSAMMGGFPISINAEDEARANSIIKTFFARMNIREAAPQDPPMHLKKFYACAIYSVMLPLLFHIAGFKQLYLGLKAKEKIEPLKLIVSLLFYLVTGVFGILLIRNLLRI